MKNIPLRKAAMIAGASLVLMTILAIIFLLDIQATFYSIVGISIIIILDITVALALYFLLKPVNKNISLSMSLFRIIYAVIFAIALYNIYDLTTFHSIWDIGSIFFGIHLFILGFLVCKSRYIPKWLGILVVIASLGYIIDPLLKFSGYTFEIGMFTFSGEVLFALWLVIKGRKISDKSIS
ncbi:DUF4386 domain-containing protein [bacterium]|nr:DUF4386 domain-containing protein [bacterium]